MKKYVGSFKFLNQAKRRANSLVGGEVIPMGNFWGVVAPKMDIGEGAPMFIEAEKIVKKAAKK